MPLTTDQINAASLYWMRVLTREITVPACSGMPGLIASLADKNDKEIVLKLTQKDPMWPKRFMAQLHSKLPGAFQYSGWQIMLDYQPRQFLKEVAVSANVPVELFPSKKISMGFTSQAENGIVIINEDGVRNIDATSFVNQGYNQEILSLVSECSSVAAVAVSSSGSSSASNAASAGQSKSDSSHDYSVSVSEVSVAVNDASSGVASKAVGKDDAASAASSFKL